MRVPRWALVFGGVMILVGGLAGAALLALRPAHTYAGVLEAPPRAAPDFTLTDEGGQAFSLAALRGQWVLLAYGYTHCPDVCPTTLNNLRQVRQDLGAQADRVRVVFVSVDPERDTAPVLEKYVHAFSVDFKGLTGAPDQVAAAAQAYGVKYEKKDIQSADGYLVNHTAFVYLIDPEFQWRVTYPFGVKPEEIAADIQFLMTAEEAKPQ